MIARLLEGETVGLLKNFRRAVCVVLVGSISSAGAVEVFRSAKLLEIDAAINHAIAEKHCPGGVLWLEHAGVSYHKAYGNRAIVPAMEPMTEDTIFDAASLTKVVACTPAIMLLIERGEVKLEATAQSYIPEFKGNGKEAITVRQL